MPKVTGIGLKYFTYGLKNFRNLREFKSHVFLKQSGVSEVDGRIREPKLYLLKLKLKSMDVSFCTSIGGW